MNAWVRMLLLLKIVSTSYRQKRHRCTRLAITHGEHQVFVLKSPLEGRTQAYMLFSETNTKLKHRCWYLAQVLLQHVNRTCFLFYSLVVEVEGTSCIPITFCHGVCIISESGVKWKVHRACRLRFVMESVSYVCLLLWPYWFPGKIWMSILHKW